MQFEIRKPIAEHVHNWLVAVAKVQLASVVFVDVLVRE
jgi:hypothetical protein